MRTAFTAKEWYRHSPDAFVKKASDLMDKGTVCRRVWGARMSHQSGPAYMASVNKHHGPQAYAAMLEFSASDWDDVLDDLKQGRCVSYHLFLVHVSASSSPKGQSEPVGLCISMVYARACTGLRLGAAAGELGPCRSGCEDSPASCHAAA